MSTVATKKEIIVMPFGIEAANPRNSDVLVQAIGNLKLRGHIKHTKDIFVRDPNTGLQTTRPTSAKLIDGLPSEIPGMELHVNPAECKYQVIDPLFDDEDMCNQIQRAIEANTSMRVVGQRIRGVPPSGGDMDKDLMKTLVREMVRLVESGDAKKVKGTVPKMEDVDELPGDYLLNPANTSGYHQPRYEKDHGAWVESLNRL